MELWEFEDCVLDWCHKYNHQLRTVSYVEEENIVQIDLYDTVVGSFGIPKQQAWGYQCRLNEDMTFKNVPHGLKGKVKGKKFITNQI